MFFTSDSHWGHGNIVKYCGRFFAMNDYERRVIERGRATDAKEDEYDEYLRLRLSSESVQKHDQALIDNWNAHVSPDDDVYHLGDFAFGYPDRMHEILGQLNGRIHIIWGNHDRRLRDRDEYDSVRNRFASTQSYKEIVVHDSDIYKNQRLVCLFHYAQRVWNKSHHGSFSLYGHSHGSLPEDMKAQSFDVGVDAIAHRLAGEEERLAEHYRPVSYDEVKAWMAQKRDSVNHC